MKIYFKFVNISLAALCKFDFYIFTKFSIVDFMLLIDVDVFIWFFMFKFSFLNDTIENYYLILN